MFEALTERLTGIFRRLSSRGKLTAKDVREGLKEIRRALLEADVNYEVVKDFIQQVQQKALGEEILRGLNPAQQIVKIVFDELVHLLGDRPAELQLRGQPLLRTAFGAAHCSHSVSESSKVVATHGASLLRAFLIGPPRIDTLSVASTP